MKKFFAGMLVLSASFSAFADDAVYPIDACTDQVKLMALAADDGLDLASYAQSPSDTDAALKAITLTDVKLIKKGNNQNVAGMYDGTYSAKVNDSGSTASVVVTATRGGCFVKKFQAK